MADKGQPLPAGPFVLLDDARRGHATSRLYTCPGTVLTATSSQELQSLLGEIDQRTAAGEHLAGYFTYEAGFALEPRLEPALKGNEPLAWFGAFGNYQTLSDNYVRSFLRTFVEDDQRNPPVIGPFVPNVSKAEYLAQFATVKKCILAGDIYQANLTVAFNAPFSGSPVALYQALRDTSQMGYGALIFDGSDWIMSLSPELFFTLKDGVISARPMKGTAPRSADRQTDKEAAHCLQTSQKNRAENLMIVDLLRNDLSRIAQPGSVEVPKLFHIESYPSVHQMTSSVTARLDALTRPSDIIKALFPCGSITGAPKIRAMELLHDIEGRARGTYCGAIGRFDAEIDGQSSAAFNVAIRTLHFKGAGRTIALGLGSGIVADSSGEAEWQECLLKGKFVEQMTRRFDLIETMAFDPERGLIRLELHLERLKASAAELGFEFDRHATRNALNAACFTLDAPSKVRLLLSPSGATAIEMRKMPDPFASPLKVAIIPLPVDRDDFRLRHKTTDRAFYDDARKSAAENHHADEVIFVGNEGHITEGSFTNVFAQRDGDLVTPPVGCGLLPGVLRAEMLASGAAKEGALRADDLSGGFQLGNSLRGMMPAMLVRSQERGD